MLRYIDSCVFPTGSCQLTADIPARRYKAAQSSYSVHAGRSLASGHHLFASAGEWQNSPKRLLEHFKFSNPSRVIMQTDNGGSDAGQDFCSLSIFLQLTCQLVRKVECLSTRRNTLRDVVSGSMMVVDNPSRPCERSVGVGLLREDRNCSRLSGTILDAARYMNTCLKYI